MRTVRDHNDVGVIAQDMVTGFKGRVTSFVYYNTGCNQASVQPFAKSDGEYVDARWIDIQRLQITDDRKLVLDNTKTPGFGSAPPLR